VPSTGTPRSARGRSHDALPCNDTPRTPPEWEMSKRNRRSRSEFLHRRSLRVMGSAAAAPGRSLPVGARMSFWPSISRRAPVNIGTVSSSRLQRRPRCAAFAAGPARRHTCGAMLPSPAPGEADKSDGRVGQQVEMSALIQRVSRTTFRSHTQDHVAEPGLTMRSISQRHIPG
jgi:hypothetical protein